MDILFKGIPPGEVEYEGTCSSCQTRVKFKRGEAKEGGDQREGFHLEVDCPVCRGKIYSNFKKYVAPLPQSYFDR